MAGLVHLMFCVLSVACLLSVTHFLVLLATLLQSTGRCLCKQGVLRRIGLLKDVWEETLSTEGHSRDHPVTAAQLSCDLLTKLKSMLHHYSLQEGPRGGLLPNPESVLGGSAEELALASQHVLPKSTTPAFVTLTMTLLP